MGDRKPVLIVMAGPNGSGKTSVTSKILHHQWLENSAYINPDIVAQERFGDWNSKDAIMKAVKYCEDWREQCLLEQKSLIFETVLSANDKVDYIERAISEHVRSSVARHLGIDLAGTTATDHYSEGVVQVLMDAVENASEPLTEQRLFNWHAALFPTGRSGMTPITVGAYRSGDEPMLVVSGTMGKHGLDITQWLLWFLLTLEDAIDSAQARTRQVIQKSLFWQRHRSTVLNERQIKMINKLWDGFEGKLSTGKWAKMTKSSQATAFRDIQDLVAKGILRKTDDKGRNAGYELAMD